MAGAAAADDIATIEDTDLLVCFDLDGTITTERVYSGFSACVENYITVKIQQKTSSWYDLLGIIQLKDACDEDEALKVIQDYQVKAAAIRPYWIQFAEELVRRGVKVAIVTHNRGIDIRCLDSEGEARSGENFVKAFLKANSMSPEIIDEIKVVAGFRGVPGFSSEGKNNHIKKAKELIFGDADVDVRTILYEDAPLNNRYLLYLGSKVLPIYVSPEDKSFWQREFGMLQDGLDLFADDAIREGKLVAFSSALREVEIPEYLCRANRYLTTLEELSGVGDWKLLGENDYGEIFFGCRFDPSVISEEQLSEKLSVKFQTLAGSVNRRPIAALVDVTREGDDSRKYGVRCEISEELDVKCVGRIHKVIQDDWKEPTTQMLVEEDGRSFVVTNFEDETDFRKNVKLVNWAVGKFYPKFSYKSQLRVLDGFGVCVISHPAAIMREGLLAKRLGGFPITIPVSPISLDIPASFFLNGWRLEENGGLRGGRPICLAPKKP